MTKVKAMRARLLLSTLIILMVTGLTFVTTAAQDDCLALDADAPPPPLIGVPRRGEQLSLFST